MLNKFFIIIFSLISLNIFGAHYSTQKRDDLCKKVVTHNFLSGVDAFNEPNPDLQKCKQFTKQPKEEYEEFWRKLDIIQTNKEIEQKAASISKKMVKIGCKLNSIILSASSTENLFLDKTKTIEDLKKAVKKSRSVIKEASIYDINNLQIYIKENGATIEQIGAIVKSITDILSKAGRLN